MPGYGPADPYYQGFQSAADPNARFGPGGGLYVSHIQFNRSSNWGRVAIARYLDFNNFEGVPAPPPVDVPPPATPAEDQSDLNASPIGFLGFTEVARGTAGQFIDKPSIAVAPGRGKGCKVPGGRSHRRTSTWLGLTFSASSNMVSRSKIYFARSTDCGKSVDGPAVKLSEGYPLSQGTTIAVHPTNPNIIYVAWRQVKIDKYRDEIIFAKSTDGGRSFTKPQPVLTPKTYVPFDQPTTSTTFRVISFPSMVMDETGRVYLAFSARVGPERVGNVPTDSTTPGPSVTLRTARVLVASTSDGSTPWDIHEVADPEYVSGLVSHQIMPTLAYAGGQFNLTWYDLGTTLLTSGRHSWTRRMP